MGDLILSSTYNEWTDRHEVSVVEWRGGPFIYLSLYAFYELFGHLDIMRGQIYQIGPYRLLAAGRRRYTDDWLFHLNTLSGWYWYLAWEVSRALHFANERLILTLAVWGLAEYRLRSGEAPSWKHVRRRWARRPSTES